MLVTTQTSSEVSDMLNLYYTLNPQKIVTTDPKGDGNRRRDEKKRKKSLFFEKGLDFFAKV